MPRRSRSFVVRIDEALTAVLAVALLLLVAVYLPSDWRRSYYGPARVIDGDTLVVGSVKTRLKGIDAPETGQFCRRDGTLWRCGEASTAALHGMIAGRNVTCDGAGRDVYNRVLAVCRVGGRDLNREMVKKGWAVAYGAYEAQEKAAKAAEAGIWSGEFERPALWREMFKGT
ncbi:thermonuclease family protein [Microbaculum marinisediminis]|uniref:Thermonuclease family protein n=1 Tax=Microbaculum marinisediminis TaxID=2931392 RepID=A0AAW5QSM2_9HYPH|nr:thermonuclease family protein [Microbaculum sp. A6E488]MCT8971106.1 thermonuclease family protein [Microbaculum sp. A6E488]